MRQGLILFGCIWAIAGIILPFSFLASAFPDTGIVTDSEISRGILFHRVAMVVLGLAAIGLGFLSGTRYSSLASTTNPDSFSDEKYEPTAWAWLVGLFAIALTLRVVGLNTDLWYDEVVTLTEYVRLPLHQLLVTYTAPNNHILFSVFAKISTNLFGESPWALRLPALVAGIASLAALYWLVLKICDRKISLLTTGLVAVSYHHIWFSQNARGYTGMLLLTLIGTGLFIEGLRRRKPEIWLIYSVVLALAMYTHLTAVFTFMGHGIVYLALLLIHRAGSRNPRLKSFASPYPGAADFWPLIGFGFGLLIVVQCYAILVPQMVQEFASRAVQVSGPNKVQEWTNPIWTAVEIFKSLNLSQASIIAILFGALLSIAGYLDLLCRKPVIAILIVLNIPITLLVVLLINFHIWPRYFFVDIGFVALIIVNGAFVIGRFLERHLKLENRLHLREGKTGIVITFLIIAASLSTLPKNYRMPKQNFTGARAYVESSRTARENVVVAGIAAYPYEHMYAPTWTPVTTIEDLKHEQNKAEHTWLVYSFPTYMKGVLPELLQYIETHFDSKMVFPGSLGDGNIYVLKSRSRP